MNEKSNKTAVDWLVEQIKSDQNQKALSASEWMQVIEQAKEMEKQMIIDAYHTNPQEAKWKNIGINYYNETYGSKGSD